MPGVWQFREYILRYADDANVYVKSQRVGERVFDSIETFLFKGLKLRVNRAKIAVARYHERGFLGFGFTSEMNLKIKLPDKSLMRFKDRIREITRRSRGIPLVQAEEELCVFLRGWIGYTSPYARWCGRCAVRPSPIPIFRCNIKKPQFLRGILRRF